MNKAITAITCTKDRPEAFALCEQYMARQTRKPDQHLVLDDGDTPAKCTMGQQHIYCPELRGRGNSMIEKLRMAFSTNGLIQGDIVVFIEDDDWYHPSWISVCEEHLQKFSIFGEGRSIYYNVRDRWWFQHENMRHASLCATAIRRDAYSTFLLATRDPNPFIDTRIWARFAGKKFIRDPIKSGSSLVIGPKAMPGTKGYSGAHSMRDPAAKNDPDLEKLRQLIGDDAEAYAPFQKGFTKPTAMKVAPHTETGRVRGPNWMRWLGHLAHKPGITGLEIGTFRGDSAEFMLENVFTAEDAKYFCVDPFHPDGSIEHKDAEIDCTENEKTARARLAMFPQCEIIKGYSEKVLRGLEVDLDFVYVDGSHTSRDVLRDAVLAFDLLKVGGVMVFDDYEWTVYPRREDCPKLGVDSFFQAYADFLEVLPPRGYQIAIRKNK